MNENKLKHLEFIQAVITRMNTNSFLIKGWTVTLVAALFALAAKDENQKYFVIAYLPIPIFWLLDAFFLSQERKYRQLYNQKRTLSDQQIDFDMSTANCNDSKNKIVNTILSKTLLIFYGIMLAIVTLIMIKFVC